MESMGFDNLAKGLSEAQPGNGWRGDLAHIQLTSLRDSSGNSVTSATTPALTISSGQAIVTFGTSSAVTAYLIFKAPMDYDDQQNPGNALSTAKKHLLLSIGAYVDSIVTDTITMTLTAVAQPPAGAAKTAFAVPLAGSAAVVTGQVTATLAEYTFDLSNMTSAEGYKIQPGDTVTVLITLPAHTTRSMIVKSVSACYSESPNFTNKVARYSLTGLEQLTP